MPRFNGSAPAAGLGFRSGLNDWVSRSRWALDKATGGGISPSDAVPFTVFSGQHLPQLRDTTAAALAAMPGLSAAQKEATLARLMATAHQAYDRVCHFQADHADSLGRRSAALVVSDKIKNGLGGGSADRNFRSGANQNLWNKHDVKSPFMQAAAGQIQHLMSGLLKQVAQEVRGSNLAGVVPKAGDEPPPLSAMVASAKAAYPDHAHAMPFAPSAPCSTAELRRAKDQLVAGVMEKFMAPAPAKLQQDGAALLLLTASAQAQVEDLVTKRNAPKSAARPSSAPTDPTTDLRPALEGIVGGLSQRIHTGIGPWLGLSQDQALYRGRQAGADRASAPAQEPALASAPAPSADHALSVAAGVLRRGLHRAALARPAGAASADLWHASRLVEGVASRAGPQQSAGAQPIQLELETRHLLQQAGAHAELSELQELVTDLQPLVKQQRQDNHQLWRNCAPQDFHKAQSIVRLTVPLLPRFRALGLEAHLPQALKNAPVAELHHPAVLGDLMTRLALAWKNPGDPTGIEALERGFHDMLTGMNKHLASSSGSASLNALARRMYAPSGPSSLTLARMLQDKTAAAQVVSKDPVLLSMQDASGHKEDAAAGATRQPSPWNTKVEGLIDALTLGAAGAGTEGDGGARRAAVPVTTAEEVLAQVAAQTQAQTEEAAKTKAPSARALVTLSHLQQQTACQIAEKTAQCGRMQTLCLLENAGDAQGVQALKDFDLHSAKALSASQALAPARATLQQVSACRRQLTAGLSDLAHDAPKAKAAQQAFNNLPLVKSNAAENAQHDSEHTHHQERRTAALTVLLKSLLAALPKNATRQPAMDTDSKKNLWAYLNLACGGHPETVQTIKAAFSLMSEGPTGTLMNHLKAGDAAGAAKLSARVQAQQKEVVLLARELVTLRTDEKALKNGHFDQMNNTVATLNDSSRSAAANAPPTAPTDAFQTMLQEVVSAMTGIDLRAPKPRAEHHAPKPRAERHAFSPMLATIYEEVDAPDVHAALPVSEDSDKRRA